MAHESKSTGRWAAPVSVALLGLLAACATPGTAPIAELTNARAAIAQAEGAGAAEKAPVELLAAREKLGRAEAASREERFEVARRLSEQAMADADLAERKARAVKAQAAATELARGNDMLRQELERKSLR
jgi:Domain of unknown function (DUF4398)